MKINEEVMKKGYYIHFQGRESIGVSKKIDMQLAEFEKHFQIEELEVTTPQRSILERIIGLWPTASIKRNYQAALNQLESPDFIYVRRTVADKEYVAFWREIKKRFPDCKIIIEIYTYPYDKDDFGKWNAWPFYFKELIYRKQLKNYIDRFVTYTDDKEIFGVKTIITRNGIDLSLISTVEGEYKEDRITLLAVAFMQRHHGYERIIEGLRSYYQQGNPQYTVELKLVGDGPEKAEYERLVEKYHLQDYIEFYPTMSGEALERLYDESDIAMASFGMYKLGYSGKLSALKTREYLAKGMPIVTGCKIDVLNDDYFYVKNFSNNKESINVNELVDFYVKIKSKNLEKAITTNEIRKYAEETVGMEKVMLPIISFIESEE